MVRVKGVLQVTCEDKAVRQVTLEIDGKQRWEQYILKERQSVKVDKSIGHQERECSVLFPSVPGCAVVISSMELYVK